MMSCCCSQHTINAVCLAVFTPSFATMIRTVHCGLTITAGQQLIHFQGSMKDCAHRMISARYYPGQLMQCGTLHGCICLIEPVSNVNRSFAKERYIAGDIRSAHRRSVAPVVLMHYRSAIPPINITCYEILSQISVHLPCKKPVTIVAVNIFLEALNPKP